MKRSSISLPLRAFALLAFGFLAHQTSAQVLDNGKLRFGNGSQNSVNAAGNLQQPFYYDAGLGQFFKLTYSIYPLDNAIGINGDGADEWNIDGDVVENPGLTSQVVDTSGFVPTNGSVGYGTIVSTGTVTINGSQTLEMRNTYELAAGKSFVKITTRLTNTGNATANNVRVWVGTRDDYVGVTDQPTKTRGNLDGNGFVALTNPATRAAAVRITSGQQGVLFYSSSPKAYTSINNCCAFANSYRQNPATALIQQTNDGSYALYVRMEDLAVGASEEFTWYYAAGAIAELTSIVGDLANEVVSSVNVTSSAGAGGTIAPSSMSVAPGAAAQFTVAPNEGYHVASVQGCSGSLSGSTYTTGAIASACNVSATFAANSYQVSTQVSAGGAVNPTSAMVNHGSTAELTVTPAPGFVIAGVSGCGGTLSGNTYTIPTVTGACTVDATFSARHTVTATADAGGAITPASVQVLNGDSASFTLTPAAGFSILQPSGCTGSLNGNIYTITNVTSSCSVAARFTATPPTFQVAPHAVFDMSSTELLTALPAAARPSAVDYLGTAAVVTLVGDQTRFAPGAHALNWHAVDARGVVGAIEQTLRVWPTVTLGPDLSIGARAGNYDSFRIALNGRSPVYPFTVRYAVSGDTQGTTLESGAVVFQDGEVEKQVPFAVQVSAPMGSAERAVQIALDDELNRGSTRPLTITLTTINQAPRVDLQIEQSGEERRVAARDAGPVTFSAQVDDPDTTDAHTVEWRAPAGATYTVSGDSLVVQPSSLPAGVHRFELIVTDDGAPPVITRRTFEVVIVETTPALPDGATRLLPNGLPDSPAYAPVSPNVLPERSGELSHHLMEADAGTRLALGSYAIYRGAYQTELPGTTGALSIPDDSVVNRGGYFDFVIDDLPRAGDSVNIVIPQRAPVPAQPVYRKYDPSLDKWQTFFEDNDNKLASAPGQEGFCPPPSSSDYRAGLNPGDWCVRLTIKDGGVNDTDGAVNGSISDPGGVGVLGNVQVTGKSSGGGGGSFELWFLLALLALLTFKEVKRRHLAALLAMAGIVSTQAQANESSSWYVGAQFGSARSDVSTSDIDGALAAQGYAVTSDVSNESRAAWRLHGGYELTDWLALEAGYSDLGEVDVGFGGPIADVDQFLIDANALQPPSAQGADLTVVARLPLGSRVLVYARAGAFFWDARYDTRNVDGQFVRRDDSGADALSGVGAQVKLLDRWSLGAEFTRFGIAGDHIDFGAVGVTFRW